MSRRTATGVGVGYTVGAGVLLPFAGPISITVFSNWNAGWYDLSADGFTLAADTSHRFFEVGIGLAFH
ncbi:MAG: hypothetical protein D6701_06465 [Gemmatimonadetes bacterium]|nr:MAG: hypothetical protein D6701_06465 [Gemmatimonadota bacterium]